MRLSCALVSGASVAITPMVVLSFGAGRSSLLAEPGRPLPDRRVGDRLQVASGLLVGEDDPAERRAVAADLTVADPLRA